MNRRRVNQNVLSLAAVVCLVSPGMLASAAGQSSPLPRVGAEGRAGDGPALALKRVTLYRSGVGYFEHRGTVTGTQRSRLSFEAEQINDILKSMVLLDLSGGRIDSVSYGSKEPLERRLRSFGVDISGAPTIADLFVQLRGASIQATTPDGPVSGTILGVETRTVVETRGQEPGTPVPTAFVNLVTGAGVRPISIPSISAFELSDPALREDLSRALAALAEHRDSRMRSVELSFAGPDGAPRDVVVAYVHETPVWKTSYRLVLPEEEEGKPRLQGWAIVENTTDHDWTDVRLSLASGRPVSFVMDLFEPIFAPRQQVAVPVTGGVLSRVFEGARRDIGSLAQGAAAMNVVEAGRRAGQMMKAAAPTAAAAEMVADQVVMLGDARNENERLGISAFNEPGAQAQADAGEIGGQFMYTLDAPITIERQRSAMLPILSAPIAGRRLSIYNRADNLKNPMRGVELANDSGLHLMPGPISVFDGGTYAGDAQIPHTSRNQERVLAYALDLDVQATTKADTTSRVSRIRVVDGLLEQTLRSRHSTEYSFDNFDSARARTVLIEHPKMAGWTLAEPTKPSEETQELYRFELPIEKGKSATLRVMLERVELSQLAITSISLETLLAYSKDGQASQAVVDAIRKAAAIQSRINDQNRSLEQLQRRRDAIATDQERIRRNMNSVQQNTQLWNRYVTMLNEQENELAKIITQQDEAQAQRNAAQDELNAYISNLTVE